MGFAIFLIIFTLVFFALDLYVYKGLNILTREWPFQRTSILRVIYWTISAGVILISLYSFITFNLNTNKPVFEAYVVFTIFIIFFTPKAFFAVFHLIEDVITLFQMGANKLGNSGEPITRTKFLSKVGLGIMSVTLLSNFFGVFIGKYRYKINRETITFKNLPKAFDGYRIVQISDIHIGSFANDHKPMRRAVEMINGLKADILLFTGDFVNNISSELEGWQPVFSNLKASDGKFSILGNHDYGDYFRFENPEAKSESLENLFRIQKDMGFNLLRNEAIEIEKDGDKIDLIGSENWGKRWKQYGDLDKAKAKAKNSFKILMSHDPSHWSHEVMGKTDIDLTLSGHTHGLQYGIEAFGIKWSPIKYAYKNWAGLYNQGNQYLYVNRGLGFVGFLGRVGIRPEITEITLKKA